MSLKVAIIEPVGGHGGMDYYDIGLCGGLAKAGVDVVLHTCDETKVDGGLGFNMRHTYECIYGNTIEWKRGFRYLKGSAKAMISALSEGRKIVHLHFFHVGALALFNVLLARLMFRRVVITAHDVESFIATLEVPIMSRIAYSLAHRVIAHNSVSQNELRDRLHVPGNKITVIPHGNYLHALRPVPPLELARKSLVISSQAKVLLFFGQIKDVKGLDILIDALPLVLKRHSETVLLIAGRPWKTDFNNYQSKIDANDIHGACITHIRYIHDDEIPLYFGAADLVVLPYRRIYQSGVLLMAMSYGKAVLVSDISGMLEIIRDGVTGFVFRSGDVDDLASKINTILSDPLSADNVARNGKDLMREDYNWEKIGRQTEKVYASLIGI